MPSEEPSHQGLDSPAPRIVYIHIPKCGGTSVADALRQTYASRRLALIDRLRRRPPVQYTRIDAPATLRASRVVGMSLSALRSAVLAYHLALDRPGVVKGHVPFSREIGDAFGRRWSFITVLRDPVDRFFSEFFYNRYKQHDHFAVGADLEEYLRTDDATRTSSQLVNFLSGRPDDRSQPTGAEIARAVDNLEYFSVIGFMDDLEAFADRLSRAFKARPCFPITNRNPAPESATRIRSDSAIRMKVEELCQADIAVYQAARARLSRG